MSDPTANRRIVLVTHSAHARPGKVAEALTARGCATEIRCTFLNDALPLLDRGRLRGYDAAVVFGGPMSAGDWERHPFLRSETAWVGRQVEADAPILGICLGAQIMARALGAAVFQHPDGKCEIGYRPIYPASRGCPVFPSAIHAYQWHREGFDLPPGARLLATGALFENQAFGCGRRAFAVQFHPEMTPATLERWVTNEKAQVDLARPEAPSPATQRADAARYDPAMHRWLDRFLDLWLERI